MNRKILKLLKKDSDRCIIGIDDSTPKNIPIIACWRIDEVHVAFWCPECDKLHMHGWADGLPNGHRWAHCYNQESRFEKTGYILTCQADLTNETILQRVLKREYVI